MRHLSSAFVLTLLFGHLVVALPVGSRAGEENTSLSHAPPCTSLERRALGKIVQAVGNSFRRLASSKSSGQELPSVGSMVRVPVGAHQTHDDHGNPLPAKVKNMEHEAVVASVEKNPHDSNKHDVGVAIITHGGGRNPKFVPGDASKYVKGPDKGSKIHVGEPFKVPLSELKPPQHSWIPDLTKFVKGIWPKKHSAEESARGQQHGDGAAGKPAKPTPPNSGAQRDRSSTPPKQGGKGGGSKSKKGGSGGKA